MRTRCNMMTQGSSINNSPDLSSFSQLRKLYSALCAELDHPTAAPSYPSTWFSNLCKMPSQSWLLMLLYCESGPSQGSKDSKDSEGVKVNKPSSWFISFGIPAPWQALTYLDILDIFDNPWAPTYSSKTFSMWSIKDRQIPSKISKHIMHMMHIMQIKACQTLSILSWFKILSNIKKIRKNQEKCIPIIPNHAWHCNTSQEIAAFISDP